MALYIIIQFGLCNHLFEILAWFLQIRLQPFGHVCAQRCGVRWHRVGPGFCWGALGGVSGAFIGISRDGDVAPSTWRGWESCDGPSRGPGTQLVVSSCSFYGCLYNCHQVQGWKLATCGATHRAQPSRGCHRCWAKAWTREEEFKAQNGIATCLFSAGPLGRRGWESTVCSPQELNRQGLCGGRTPCLHPRACPLPGCCTAPCKAEPEQYKMLDNKQRPRESCLPLGMADNRLGSLCLFRQVCLLEPGFWPSLGYLTSLRASAPASGEWD